MNQSSGPAFLKFFNSFEGLSIQLILIHKLKDKIVGFHGSGDHFQAQSVVVPFTTKTKYIMVFFLFLYWISLISRIS